MREVNNTSNSKNINFQGIQARKEAQPAPAMETREITDLGRMPAEVIGRSQVTKSSLEKDIAFLSNNIEKVEKIIAENLPKIKEKVPTIIDGPFYWGVDELGDWGMKLLFAAQCTEDTRYPTQRAINKELKNMFDENGIKVATPKITVEKE